MGYVVRALVKEDFETVDAYLKSRGTEAHNIRALVMQGGFDYSGNRHEAQYWGAFFEDQLKAVVSYTWNNKLQLSLDEKDSACVPLLAKQLLQTVKQRLGNNPDQAPVESIMGPRKVTDIFADEWLINKKTSFLWGDDGLYSINLKKIKQIDLKTLCAVARPAEIFDKEWLVGEWADFFVEALSFEKNRELRKKAEGEVERLLHHHSLYVLEIQQKPCAFCGVIKMLPEVVKVGPVWTNPSFRGRGYAKALTSAALKLALEKDKALAEAYLIAYRTEAVRAYKSIGFKKICNWRFALPKKNHIFGSEKEEYDV